MGLSTLSWVVLVGSAVSGICVTLGIFCCILLIAGGIMFVCGYDSCTNKENQKPLRVGGVLSIVIAIMFGLTAALMPSEKAIYMVAGIELVNKFSKTETAQELGDSGMSIVKDITTIIHDYTYSDKDRRR